MATFNIVGLYKITPKIETLGVAARYLGYDWLINEKSEYLEGVDWSSIKNLGLLELEVSGEYSPKDLMNIHHDEQYPYLEFYLNQSGESLIDIKTIGADQIFRVCFYLHFIDITKPLNLGQIEVQLPEMSELPPRLIPFAHYVPVD